MWMTELPTNDLTYFTFNCFEIIMECSTEMPKLHSTLLHTLTWDRTIKGYWKLIIKRKNIFDDHERQSREMWKFCIFWIQYSSTHGMIQEMIDHVVVGNKSPPLHRIFVPVKIFWTWVKSVLGFVRSIRQFQELSCNTHTLPRQYDLRYVSVHGQYQKATAEFI